jgi:hypothetical protein
MGTAVTTAPTSRELEQLRYEREMRQRSIAREYQSRADAVFCEWGTRAKQRIEGTDPEDFRRDLAVQLKRLLPYSDDKPAPDLPTFRELRSIKLWGLSKDAFEAVEPMVYRAASLAYARNDTCAPGETRMVRRKDPQTGQEMILFYGQRSFIEDFKSPAFRARIRNPDTDPGWFRDSARQAPAPIGYDQSGWQNAYRKFQISQGYLG